LDKLEAEAELKSYKKKWFAKRKGIATLIKEVLSQSESVLQDNDAVNKSIDADLALQELADDVVAYGYYTACIVLQHKDIEVLQQQVKEVETTIHHQGFVTIKETLNAVDAWLGTLPGNCRNNVRRPLLNTLNLAHVLPLSALWAGQNEDVHLKSPPLLYALTNGSTPFRLCNHIGDVGHTLIIGPTGAGKSVLLNIIAVQFLRYSKAQVYLFDKGGSARILTYGVGGDYYDLGAEENTVFFQPLANIDNESEKRWAHEWIIDILRQENMVITSDVKSHVWLALTSLASAPKEERTLYGLSVLLQDKSLREAIKSYTIDGPYGQLLDNKEESLHESDWQCFEMDALLQLPILVAPVLMLLFHRLSQRFTGRPTLLILDEAWRFLDNELFAGKIREWLKELRKSNVSVIFATQSLADIETSSIVASIKESCLTKIYLPNPHAKNEDGSRMYHKFGLNERQIEVIAHAIPKQDYYYTSPLGNRLFELHLGELALAYCAATSKESQLKAQKLFDASLTTNEFNQQYLKAAELQWAVESIDLLTQKTDFKKEEQK